MKNFLKIGTRVFYKGTIKITLKFSNSTLLLCELGSLKNSRCKTKSTGRQLVFHGERGKLEQHLGCKICPNLRNFFFQGVGEFLRDKKTKCM